LGNSEFGDDVGGVGEGRMIEGVRRESTEVVKGSLELMSDTIANTLQEMQRKPSLCSERRGDRDEELPVLLVEI
jgi:hypothetical protein